MQANPTVTVSETPLRLCRTTTLPSKFKATAKSMRPTTLAERNAELAWPRVNNSRFLSQCGPFVALDFNHRYSIYTAAGEPQFVAVGGRHHVPDNSAA